jgi:hypothetical protein
LRSHPAVRDAVVLVRDERLVAYAAGAATPDELRAHLAAWLPDFMLPSALVVLDSLPLTPSGKVDRPALPDPDAQAEVYVPPRTPLEEAVAAIWSDVLGVERIGVHDDFFALGGHSLLATQVVAHVRSSLAVDLPLHFLFTAPTVASLSREIIRVMGEEDEEAARLVAELASLSDEEAERLVAGADG